MRGRSVAVLIVAGTAVGGGMLYGRAYAAFRADRDTPQHEATGFLHDIVAPATRPGGNPLWAVPLDALPDTRERPIFTASRRPPAPAIARAAPPLQPPEPAKRETAERPRLQLVGTVSGGALHLGLFLDEVTQKPTTFAVGESQDGWTLLEVNATEARFQSTERMAILPLRPPQQDRPRTALSSTMAAEIPPARHRRR